MPLPATLCDVSGSPSAPAEPAPSGPRGLARVRAATDRAPMPAVVVDPDGHCVSANEAWLRFTGLASSAAAGEGWLSAIHPDDREGMIASLRAALRDREGATTEYRARRCDGDFRSVVQSLIPLNVPGDFPGGIVSLIDVTADRRAATVAHARLRINALAQHADIDQVIQAALDEAEALTSSQIAFFHFLQPDQRTLTLQTWSTNTLARMCTAEGKGAHYPVDKAGVWADSIRQRRPTIHNDYASLPDRRGLPEGHAPVHSELVVPVLRGELIVAIMGVGNAARPYGEEDVAVVRAMADLAYDAADRRRTLDALARSEERLRLAIEATSDGLWDWDLKAQFVWWSPRIYQMLEYDPVAVDTTSTWVTSLVHPEDRERVTTAFNRHVAAESPTLSIEARWRTGKGEWRWFLTRGQVAARDEQGRPRRIIGTHQDISSRRREEAERLQMERRLLQTQKLESLGVLAGGIAHDFNNLLTVMVGNIELALLDVTGEPAATASLEEAAGAAKRASELTRQLLAYTGQARHVVSEVDVNALLEDNAHLFRTAVEKNVSLAIQPGPAPRRVKGDAGQIQQVVLNLVVNASEAIGSASGSVSVSTGCAYYEAPALSRVNALEAPAPGDYTWIEVTDTGCGMDEDTLARMWDPFFSTKFLGRGLGMPAVLGIVRAHRGWLTVDSAPGRGTTIRVLLPCLAERVGHRADAVSVTGLATGAVLIVDDEAGVRALCQRSLGRAGYATLVAEDGEDALRVFASERDHIALVLLDLTMPRLDGLSALRKLRQIKPDVPVVLCSGFAEQDATRGFEDERLTGFLSKPYSAAELLDIVARTAGRPGPRA